jgi:hypothetical protein
VKEYTPLETFGNNQSLLPLIALFTVLGGLFGLAFHQFRPPVYEAVALLEINVDLTVSDFAQDRTLNELEQDQAIGAAQAVILSKDVFDEVQKELDSQGYSIAAAPVAQGGNFYIERRHALQYLRVRDGDPNGAAAAATLWAEKAYEALLDAHRHSTQARMWLEVVKALQSCVVERESQTAAPSEVCSSINMDELQDRLEEAHQKFGEEALASRGLINALRFDYTRPASVPDAPAVYRLNLLILSGALIGFFGGTFAAASLKNKAQS